MADYDWFEKDYLKEEREKASLRKQGFNPVTNSYGRVTHYLCRRGCGTLVWNIEDHAKNVCTDWSNDEGHES